MRGTLLHLFMVIALGGTILYFMYFSERRDTTSQPSAPAGEQMPGGVGQFHYEPPALKRSNVFGSQAYPASGVRTSTSASSQTTTSNVATYHMAYNPNATVIRGSVQTGARVYQAATKPVGTSHGRDYVNDPNKSYTSRFFDRGPMRDGFSTRDYFRKNDQFRGMFSHTVTSPTSRTR